MKVLLVIESLGSGGAERQLVGLAKALAERGCFVNVLVYDDRNFYKSFLDDAKIDCEVYSKALNRYFRWFYLGRRASQYSPDVIISYLPGPNVALSMAKILGILKCKLVVSERNFTWNWTFKNKLFFSLYRKANAIVANSKAEADNILSAFPYYKNKVCYIRNFVDFNKFKPAYTEANKTFKILTIARIREYKNVHGLISAAKILKDEGYKFEIDWFGHDYNDEYSFSIKQMIEQFNLSDIFKIYPPTENVESLYPKYDLFCLPSFKEGYPNVIVEAMSCQIPVVCSNICENPNIVEDGINGFLFDPYDSLDMVDKLKKMILSSNEVRKKMGISSREKVIRNNSIDFFVDNYIALINKVICVK